MSGLGAGIDSYYEYLLKVSVLSVTGTNGCHCWRKYHHVGPSRFVSIFKAWTLLDLLMNSLSSLQCHCFGDLSSIFSTNINLSVQLPILVVHVCYYTVS